MTNRQTAKKIGITPETGNPDDLLNPAVVAEWLGVTEQWLQQIRAKNLGPKFIKLGQKSVRYRRDDVREWIDAKFKAAHSLRSRRSSNRISA
jgi:predicted DNA-binding transcriptional regulator AlpA